jgi:serine protease AprX
VLAAVKLDLRNLGPWIFGTEQLKRFTQDSPVMPDVWLAYGREPNAALDLLLEPHASATTATLAQAVLEADHSPKRAAPIRLAYNQSHVAVQLTFVQLLRSVLPLSKWWQQDLWPPEATSVAKLLAERHDELVAGLQEPMREQGRRPVRAGELPGALVWFTGLVGRIAWEAGRDPGAEQPEDEPPPGLTYDGLVDLAAEAVGDLQRVPQPPGRPLLWAVNRNRPARPALWRSRKTIKADAATLLFGLTCGDIGWAVIDSGVDATHPAFAVRDGAGAPTERSRVRATYDFTRLRTILAGSDADRDTLGDAGDRERKEIERRLHDGRPVDWALLAERLEVTAEDYAPPRHEHGTHVAGILAADWRTDDPQPAPKDPIRGICPDIGVYDLRVFDDDGAGDEFAILAALQFVRWLNANSPAPAIHGVNLSLSLDHEVGAYACGRTPVCDECERLIGSGTIVVAAAGNEGRAFFSMASGVAEGYRQMSITDPGNADAVITVGATHRHEPHTFGVSYFSSRGPTGDGRAKPDIVAPGEKITAPVPGGGLKSLDGTSMAAPHVSGAAALILARHPELIGRPAEIKQVLCATATDLGRERYFQGSGVVDALRAIQSL